MPVVIRIAIGQRSIGVGVHLARAIFFDKDQRHRYSSGVVKWSMSLQPLSNPPRWAFTAALYAVAGDNEIGSVIGSGIGPPMNTNGSSNGNSSFVIASE